MIGDSETDANAAKAADMPVFYLKMDTQKKILKKYIIIT